jgi:hypothetical protein
MGFPIKRDKVHQIKKKKDYQAKIKKYYAKLLRMHTKIGYTYGVPAKRIISSILTKGNRPTQTFSNRDLGLMDIDKLLSFDMSS